MPLQDQVQIQFGGGMNAVAPSHLVKDDEVATATNVDFSLERGGANCRRGSALLWSVAGAAVNQIYRYYNVAGSLSASPVYANVGGTVYRGISGSFSSILSGAGSQLGFSGYRQHAFIAGSLGTLCVKDDGTSVTDWVKQSPPQAPGIVVDTLGAFAVIGSSAYFDPAGTATFDGTATYVGEGTLNGTDLNTPSVKADVTTFRVAVYALPASTNMDDNGGSTIGDYGVDSILIKFSDPTAVTKVSRDYSIGNAEFINYYHTEMDVGLVDVDTAVPDTDVLIDTEQTVNDGNSTALTAEDRQRMAADSRTQLRMPVTRVSAAAGVFNVWAVPRTKFELVGRNIATSTSSGLSMWTNIRALRIIVECTKRVDVHFGGWQIIGAVDHPLTDPDVGYTYWETWAKVENGVIVAESAPSPPSARMKVQNVRMIAVCSGTPTGNHDLNYRVIYRQGGYLADAYRVGTTTTFAEQTFSDTVTDIQALSANNRMVRNLLSRSEFPSGIVAVSEPFHDRLFVGHQNKIRWSLPGSPGAFPRTSVKTVSNSGDEIAGLVPWGNSLVIINRDSVWELQGTEFEGVNDNSILQKSGSRHGSRAPKTIIRTPYGIPLLDYDGLFMYIPGQGVDTEVSWVAEKLADAWRGTAASDPAAIKGNRLQPINFTYLANSVCAYADGKLYLGVATGSSSVLNSVYVLDARTQQCWYYTYSFNFASLWWDFENNRLLAGSTGGKIMQLEVGTQDQTESGSSNAIVWKVRSKAWTTPSDTVLENVAVDYKGGTAILTGLIDGTATNSLATFTNTVRDWNIPALGGSVGNNISFELNGAQASGSEAAIYGVTFDALYEPKRVTFFKTDYEVPHPSGESRWIVHYADIEIIGSSTILGTVYVDGTVVMTSTCIGPTQGRNIFTKAYPNDTYGKVGHTIYNAQAASLFKHWATRYDATQEPPKIDNYKTEVQSQDEVIVDGFDFDANPNGTLTSTLWVDNVAIANSLFAGTSRQSYTWASFPETYGRTLFITHSGLQFKIYKEWFHTRPEPDRWQCFVTDRQNGNETRWQTFEVDANSLGNTVLATLHVDANVIGTYTLTATNRRQSQVFSIPQDIYGRTIWVEYNVSANGRFKHYRTWFEGEEEPDRVTVWQTSEFVMPTDADLRTWAPQLNPLGTVVGTLLADGTAIKTATFTGTQRKTYNVGIDLDASMVLVTGSKLVAIYNSSNVFKHYKTDFEQTLRPFMKNTWKITYTKEGGASQLDIGRFYTLDIEPLTTATITAIWDLDGSPFSTNTLTFTGREWRDQIAMPPGMRGYLFELRMRSAAGQDFRVWKSTLETLRVGVKGLSVNGYAGKPVVE